MGIHGIDEITFGAHDLQRCRQFFLDWGLSPSTAQEATQEIIKDDKKWVDFMMKHELGLEAPDPKRARKSAFNIGFSYIVGGLIPLTPYFFINTAIEGLKISAIITLACLYIFGFFKRARAIATLCFCPPES